MQLSRIPHYLKKIIQLGPRTSFVVAKNRLQAAWHEQRVRRAALHGTAAHTWPIIALHHGSNKNFSLFWQEQKKKKFSFLDRLYADQPMDAVIAQADLFEQKVFDLLGSGPLQFSTMPWHLDFRLQAQNKNADCSFDKTMFYKDIHVRSGTTDQLVKDIKVPWELSRCQHLMVLAMAYAHTNDERYARVFVEHVNDWMNENPYLLGANWVCPMDVGIRALNWISAFHYFRNSSTVPEQFWQRFVCSLYDHFIYLENNWEIYDGRTSNHYLSDLVGYLYLCSFFDSFIDVQEKFVWCRLDIIREFEKQVFGEGTDYEGSTGYHRLVTELFYHAYVVAEHAGMPFDDAYEQKLRRMFDFIAWCDGVQVGDNDSGKILYYGITPAMIAAMRNKKDTRGIKTFPAFGISFLKSSQLLVSLRHHAYTQRQPSGHFHNDVGSITVSVQGVPIVVDPGSYVYTPSAYWRNYFRSVQQHNTFSLASHEPVPLDERLFALDLPEQSPDKNNESLSTSYSLYPGVSMHRKMVCAEDTLIITDWLLSAAPKRYHVAWHFVLAPEVQIRTKEHEISLYVHDKKRATLHTELDFMVTDTWFSSAYGKRVPTKKLQAYAVISSEEKRVITLLAR